MRNIAVRTVDGLVAGLIAVFGPLLRRVGRSPGRFPMSLRQSDRSGVQVRSTHYYHPTYANADLPARVTEARVLPGLDLRETEQLRLLDSFPFQHELAAFGDTPPPVPGFAHGNGLYEYADAESLYAMLRTRKPRCMIEIGSGNSTWIAKAALDANRADDPAYRCRHVCVEPYEMPWLEQLGVEVVRERVQDVPLELFSELQRGDVLFIDSSHVIRPFGDVLFEFQTLIPSLPAGVLVHVHDIFTPRDYPEAWLREERRLWNEQYLLETMLAHNPRYKVVLALNWLRNAHREALFRAFPAAARKPERQPGAFWFEIAG